MNTITKLNTTDKQLEKHLKRLQKKNNKMTEYAFTNDELTVATDSHRALKINQTITHDELIKVDSDKTDRISSLFKLDDTYKMTLTREMFDELRKVSKMLHSIDHFLQIEIEGDKAIFTNRKKNDDIVNSFSFNLNLELGTVQLDTEQNTKNNNFTIILNANYIAQALDFSYDNKDHAILIEFTDHVLKPIKIKDYNEEVYEFLILPLRYS